MRGISPTGEQFAETATKERIAELWERHLLDHEKIGILEQRNIELVREKNQIAAQKTEALETLVASDRQSVLENRRFVAEFGERYDYKEQIKGILKAIPHGPVQGSRYDTNNKLVLTIFTGEETFDIEILKL